MSETHSKILEGTVLKISDNGKEIRQVYQEYKHKGREVLYSLTSTPEEFIVENIPYKIVKRLFGIGGGTQEVVSQNVGKVIIDGKELNNIEIEFGDIHAELGINGFVGNDLLSRFSILIDYPKQEIQFRE